MSWEFNKPTDKVPVRGWISWESINNIAFVVPFTSNVSDNLKSHSFFHIPLRYFDRSDWTTNSVMQNTEALDEVDLRANTRFQHRGEVMFTDDAERDSDDETLENSFDGSDNDEESDRNEQSDQEEL